MSPTPSVETVAPIVELLMECRSSRERHRLILETALATGTVQSAGLWRRVRASQGAPVWQPIVARGPAELLPTTAQVAACADDALPGGPPGRRAVAVVEFAGEERALGLGDVEDEEWVDLLEALLFAATIVEASEAELGIDASLIASLDAPLPSNKRTGSSSANTTTESDRARAVGDSANGLRHDLRNLLTSIRLTEDICGQMGDPEGRFGHVLEREYARAGDLLGRVLAPHAGAEARSECAPGRILRERAESHRAALASAGVTLGCDVDPRIEGERWPLAPARLERIVDNLLVNAREALGERGGRVRIRFALEGGQATLDIEDDGPGIDDELLPSVFEKGASAGKDGHSGLGLAMIREWVEGAGGTIEASRSRLGGASFRIRMGSGPGSHPGRR